MHTKLRSAQVTVCLDWLMRMLTRIRQTRIVRIGCSPLSWHTLQILSRSDEELGGRDQYCLVQIWRVVAGIKAG